MKIRQKTSIKHQNFLVWCYKAPDDNFDKLCFPWICLRLRNAKIYDDPKPDIPWFTSIGHPLSLRWKIIMISVIFLRGQTCETKKEILKFLRCKKMLEIYYCAIIDLWFQSMQLRHWNEISYVWFIEQDLWSICWKSLQSFCFDFEDTISIQFNVYLGNYCK